MPNWVNNNVTVNGSSDALNKFWEHIQVKPRLCNDSEENFTMSFHSFVTDENLDYDVYHGIHGSGPDGPVGDTEDNWYPWNNKHWGTKWDACEAYTVRYGSETPDGGFNAKSIAMEFQTAWSAPELVFLAMATQWPDLTFEVWWEEEQGFGESATYSAGSFVITDTWDIPNSHEDYVNRDNPDGCICSWDDNKENWYEDCPGKAIRVYTVEVVTKYTVVAQNEEQAIKAAEASESGYDMPNNTTVREALYAEEYRVVGMTEEKEEDDE